LDDYELIIKIIQGDKNLYAKIMDKYHNEMFKFIYNLLGSYDETEDLLQEIFFKLYKNLKKYDSSKASFRTWMYRIGRNHVLNHLNSAKHKLKKKTYEYDDEINRSDDNIEKQAVKDDQINRILMAMEKVLKPKHYQIMQLHYFSNLTVQEISEVMQIPDKTIYKAIKTSIEKIKEEVGE